MSSEREFFYEDIVLEFGEIVQNNGHFATPLRFNPLDGRVPYIISS